MLKIQLKLFRNDDDHDDLLATRLNMGRAPYLSGRFDEAGTLFMDVPKALVRVHGADSENMAPALVEMGYFLVQQEMCDGALRMFERALFLLARIMSKCCWTSVKYCFSEAISMAQSYTFSVH